MLNRSTTVKIFSFTLLMGFLVDCQGDGSGGTLARLGKSSEQALQMLGTASASDVARIIKKYAPYVLGTDQQKTSNLQDEFSKSSFINVLQERALLSEALFAQLSVMMNVPVMTGIDQTKTTSIDAGIILRSGLEPHKADLQETGSSSKANDNSGGSSVKTDQAKSVQVSSNKQVMQLPEMCSTLFQVSRYIRGLGSSFGQVKTMPTAQIDSFYGVILVNIGWYGSAEKPASFNTQAGDTQKNNIYWIQSGVTMTSFGENKTFVSPQSAGLGLVAGGVDIWPSENGARAVSFVMTDRDGSASLSSQDKPFQITVAPVKGSDIPRITLVNADGSLKEVELNDAAKTALKSSVGLPWALLVISSNSSTSTGPELQPSLKVKGIVQLSPEDFPPRYQAENASFVKQPFTGQVLSQGMRAFKQQLAQVPLFSGSSVSQTISFGQCEDVSLRLSLSTSDPDGMYIQPVNAALAKYQGALSFDWGAGATIGDALAGNLEVMKNAFFKRDNLTAQYLLSQVKEQMSSSGQSSANIDSAVTVIK